MPYRKITVKFLSIRKYNVFKGEHRLQSPFLRPLNDVKLKNGNYECLLRLFYCFGCLFKSYQTVRLYWLLSLCNKKLKANSLELNFLWRMVVDSLDKYSESLIITWKLRKLSEQLRAFK